MPHVTTHLSGDHQYIQSQERALYPRGKREKLYKRYHFVPLTRRALHGFGKIVHTAASHSSKAVETHKLYIPPFSLSLSTIWRDLSWLSFSSFLSARLALARNLRARGEKLLLQHDTELFPDALQLLHVLVVLALVLDLGVDACGAVLVLLLICTFFASGKSRAIGC